MFICPAKRDGRDVVCARQPSLFTVPDISDSDDSWDKNKPPLVDWEEDFYLLGKRVPVSISPNMYLILMFILQQLTHFRFRTAVVSVSHRNVTASQGTTTKSNPPPRKQRRNARQQRERTQLPPLLLLLQVVLQRRVLLRVLLLFHRRLWTLYPHRVWGSMVPQITITLQWLHRFSLYRLLWKEKGRTTMIMTLKIVMKMFSFQLRDLSATVYIDRRCLLSHVERPIFISYVNYLLPWTIWYTTRSIKIRVSFLAVSTENVMGCISQFHEVSQSDQYHLVTLGNLMKLMKLNKMGLLMILYELVMFQISFWILSSLPNIKNILKKNEIPT